MWHTRFKEEEESRMEDREEMKKSKNGVEGKSILPARDRRRARRPAERRGWPRPRFHPGWSPSPAWGHTRKPGNSRGGLHCAIIPSQ